MTDAKDRIIVALDVPSAKEAQAIVAELGDLVSFYKVGLELLMTGDMGALLRELVRHKKVFLDVKMPGDIPETVSRAVQVAAELGVTFLTLSHTATPDVVRAALAGRGARPDPKLLFVAFLSSLDKTDFSEQYGRPPEEFESFIEQRVAAARNAGVDGFIVSGQQIALLKKLHPSAVLVSPGIRPAGAALDDHKRSCTPAEAIALGAEYIVVGRPITRAPNRRAAAQGIIDELTSS